MGEVTEGTEVEVQDVIATGEGEHRRARVVVKDGKVKEEATGVILVGNKTDLVRSRHSTLEGQTMINLYLNLHR